LGQAEAEVSEQLGGGGLRRRHHAQSQFGAQPGALDRNDHVHALDGGDFLDQLAELPRPLACIHCSSVRHNARARKHTRMCACTRSSF